jgi:hypothetical protein
LIGVLAYFYSSSCDIQKCPLIGVLAVFLLTNQRTFLNITTTGVKIPQAHQSKDISEYYTYWSKNTASTPIKGEMSFDWCACCIFTPVVVIFRNVL